MIRRLIALTLAVLLAGCSDPAADPDVRPWRFALEEIRGSVQDAYAQAFKERIEQRSGGRIQVEVYPYGALGTSAQLTELVQNGAIQFAFASPGHLGSVVPESQVFSLHFLFSDDEQVNQTILSQDEELYRLLDGAYAEHGLKLFGIIQEGWMVWTGNKPLTSPAAFDGFKIRTMVSPLLVEAYEAYGASPTPMPYAEVYGGLQLNMIDGQVNPVFAIEEMSFYEVQEAMTFANHLPFVSSLVMNPAFHAGLRPEEREMLREVKAELDDYIFDVQRRFNSERLDRIRADSDIQMVELNDDQRAVFRNASLSVRDSYVATAGPRGSAILERVETARQALEAQVSSAVSAPSE